MIVFAFRIASTMLPAHFFRILSTGILLLASAPSMALGLLYQLPYQWADSDGHAAALRQMRGTPTVITMSYGACKKICSSALYKMEQMQAIADHEKTPIQFVVVSLDPTKDTPEDWRDFRRDHKLTRANWIFLSGSAATIRGLAGDLGINYWIYHDHVLHDFSISLLDTEGNVLRKMIYSDDSPATFLQPVLAASKM